MRLDWVATFFLCLGAAMTAMNIFPLCLIPSTLGNLLWGIEGYRLKKFSLVFTSIMMTVIFVGSYFLTLVAK